MTQKNVALYCYVNAYLKYLLEIWFFQIISSYFRSLLSSENNCYIVLKMLLGPLKNNYTN
jgi:hypothetical protein